MDPNGTDANGSPPVIKAKFSGFFSSKAYNHAIHSIGPAPFMPQHMSAAMQRPWNNHDDVNNTSPEGDTTEPALNGHRSGSAAEQVSSQERMPAAAQTGDLAAAFQAPRDKENLQVPPQHKQMKDEDPWWDIFPKLSMCAMTQFGCCAGNDQTKSIARRKALCGVGIVFTEANHGALVVQQVVPRSPAEACGKIKSGDELLSIDGKHVYRMNADTITPLVLGEEGSDVVMTFLRRQALSLSSDKGEKIQVQMKRRYFMAPQPSPT